MTSKLETFSSRRAAVGSSTRREVFAAGVATASVAILATSMARAQCAETDPAPAGVTPPTGTEHDYDYHLGDWTVVNRRLKRHWTTTPEWEVFTGTDRYVQFMDGMVSLDVFVSMQKGFKGTTVRVFNPVRRQWSIYWIHSKVGALSTPYVGGFQGNLGTFYSDDTDDGVPIKARMFRYKQPPNKERFEQAFSRDGCKTWENELDSRFHEGRMSIVELRQYTLKPGMRDVLIELFEREFVESQEALGMEIIGTFRDADDPDRFVWLRGFADMEARAKSLAAFYGGPVWQAHRAAANATMLDSDNVLLLRPAWPGSGFGEAGARAPVGAVELPSGVVAAVVCHFDAPIPEEFVAAFRDAIPAGQILAALVAELAVNNFPALPVREGENVFVWFALLAELESARRAALPPQLRGMAIKSAEVLRLLPTARSRLHG